MSKKTEEHTWFSGWCGQTKEDWQHSHCRGFYTRPDDTTVPCACECHQPTEEEPVAEPTSEATPVAEEAEPFMEWAVQYERDGQTTEIVTTETSARHSVERGLPLSGANHRVVCRWVTPWTRG